MDAIIALFLAQDGITNGAIYALLAMSLVLVFTVTRVIFVPQGEFVAYGGLTVAMLEKGMVPGTVWLLLAAGLAAFLDEALRVRVRGRRLLHAGARDLVLPALVVAAAHWLAPLRLGFLFDAALTLAIVVPLGPAIYRVVFRPMADATVLVLLIASVGVHLALVGLGLVFFGPEGYRTTPFTTVSLTVGPTTLSGQSLWVLAVTGALIAALWLFFERTFTGKALRATAVNRLGARLVGIAPQRSGRLAFAMAASIGTVSGILIGPATTVFYDTGFLTGLKGFVAAIIGGLVSYPVGAAAAILVGVVEAFASFWASSLKEVIVFTIILPVLLWRSLRLVHVEDEE